MPIEEIRSLDDAEGTGWFNINEDHTIWDHLSPETIDQLTYGTLGVSGILFLLLLYFVYRRFHS